MLITPAGGGGIRRLRRRSHRGQITVIAGRRATERTRTSDEIAMDLRRKLSGLPGVIVRARPSGGNFQLQRIARRRHARRRLALEIRGHDLDDARRLSHDAQACSWSRRPASPTSASAEERPARDRGPRRSRQGGAARPDRDRRRQHHPHQRRRHAGGDVPRARQRVPDRRPAARRRIASASRRRRRAPQHADRRQVVPAKNVMRGRRRSAARSQIERKNLERITRVNAEIEITLSEAVAAVQARLPPDRACRRTSPSASAPRSRNRPSRSASCSWC